jgi:hypothetical protein
VADQRANDGAAAQRTKFDELRGLAERRFARGDAAFVAHFGIYLDDTYGSGTELPDRHEYRNVAEYLLRLLTITPGRKNIKHALRLISVMGTRDPTLPRHAASLLAFGQHPVDLAAAFTARSVAGAITELRACLIHELLLRRVILTDIPQIDTWTNSAEWRRHPLSRLPLSLTDLEQSPTLRSYRLCASSHEIPNPWPDGMSVPPDPAADAPVVTPVPATADDENIRAAVQNWVECSGGRVETRVFELSGHLAPGAVARLLAEMKLECLDGLGADGEISVGACPPQRVWEVLFSAASTGGAWNNGVRGAYGRLAAWQSLAGLVGAAGSTSVAEVERRVRQCDWFGFTAGSEWFGEVWTVGVLAVDAHHRRIALLAACDAD